MLDLSLSDARRLALDALGYAAPRPRAPTTRHLRAVIARLGVLQMDSVNVLARAHYMPAFSRIGPYARRSLDELAYRKRELFEYWGHEASLLPVESYHLFRWRMEAALDPASTWRYSLWARQNAALVEDVYRQVADRGPIGASELTDRGRRSGPWWGWASGKSALEWLFYVGRLTAADRRNFERMYDLTERVLPAPVLERRVPREDAQRGLVAIAVRALGVATAKSVADYFRIPVKTTTLRLAELVEGGEVVPARVEGLSRPAFARAGARAPRRVEARALVSPFDPAVWERARAEWLFGFHYRIEIYTPEHKRVHGYYVLPFLLGDRFVARVDLKADRKARALVVNAAHREDHAARDDVVDPLAESLEEVATWLEMDSIVVRPKGKLAGPLRAAMRARA